MVPKVEMMMNETLTLEEQWRAASAELEKFKTRDGYLADCTVHYRNLAIILGAKPDQMIGSFDRGLCESGIDPDETSGGYHVSINQELGELRNAWDEVERLECGMKWAYTERNRLAVVLAQIALERGWAAGRHVDPTQDPEWRNVVIIDLPTGQISFHIGIADCSTSGFKSLPRYPGTWDGHTTDEKWERVSQFVNQMSTGGGG